MPIIGVLFPRFYAVGPGLIGVVSLSLLWLKQSDKKPVLNCNIILFPATLWLLSAISIGWSIDPDVSFERTQKLLIVFIPGIALLTYIQTINIKHIKRYLPLLALGLALGALFTSLELLSDSPLYKITRSLTEVEHFRKAAYNRGSIAITLCLIPVFFMLKNTIHRKRVLIALTVTMLSMLYVIESQSAQLAIIIGLLAYWVFPYQHKYAWYGLIAVISLLFLTAPFSTIFLYDHFSSTLDNLPFFGNGDGYAGGRIEIWHFVSTRALQSPLIGHGIEATKVIKDFETEKLYHEATHVLHPHNVAVQLWIEFGILGAAIISGLTGYLLLLIKKLNLEQQRIALPTFIACLSVAATGYGFWQSWWLGLLFMVAGLCILAIKLVDEKNGAHSKPA